jgi:serine/threonine protein kinase
MTDDRRRWPRIKEIFHAALAQAPDDRAAFLRDACAGDEALRQEVASLLAAHAEAGSFAERAAIDALGSGDSSPTARDVPALAAGAELGPYRILGPLDAGGMGEVYRALDTRLHRDVAVKVLPRALSDDPERVARLEREARLLAALNHPHIATIHGLEIADGLSAIVMELIEGPTLADRLSTGPLTLDVALDMARQIADALEAAHGRGIIHRDLKPANVKLTAAGTVKVLDFGLAETMAPGPREVRVEPAVAGTPGYMSPEQARGERVDARADIWAFGCLVYEMLAGQPARGEPDWERLPSNVPAGIRRMLRRCMEPDVEAPPPSHRRRAHRDRRGR